MAYFVTSCKIVGGFKAFIQSLKCHIILIYKAYAPVAQLDRAPGFEPDLSPPQEFSEHYYTSTCQCLKLIYPPTDLRSSHNFKESQ